MGDDGALEGRGGEPGRRGREPDSQRKGDGPTKIATVAVAMSSATAAHSAGSRSAAK